MIVDSELETLWVLVAPLTRPVAMSVVSEIDWFQRCNSDCAPAGMEDCTFRETPCVSATEPDVSVSVESVDASAPAPDEVSAGPIGEAVEIDAVVLSATSESFAPEFVASRETVVAMAAVLTGKAREEADAA